MVAMSFRKVVVGISGGVDSAVAAFLLKQKGFDVHGAFMKNWDVVDEFGKCPGEADWEDAQFVCRKLNIPITHINFVKDYWNEVFGSFIKDYESGLTPNPDILCNKHIKFDVFFRHALSTMKADAIATGHYARSSFGDTLENYNQHEDPKLLCALDKFKDQTFFLSQMPGRALRKTMFPLGSMLKKDVKTIAKSVGLENIARKGESVGICFIGARNFKNFISEYVTATPGEFIDIDSGKVVGQHNGIHQWTVGQRCKIGSCLQPYFVYRKDLNTNAIFVAAGTDHPLLYTQIMYTEPMHWIRNRPPSITRSTEILFRCQFRFQHTKPLIECIIIPTNNELLTGRLLVQLGKPLRAITAGQYAVFYKDNECLGCARIKSPGPSQQYTNVELQK